MGEIWGLHRTGFPPRPKRHFHFRQPDVPPEVTPAPPGDICPKQTCGPLRAVQRNQAEPCLRNKEPAVESRADQHPTPVPAPSGDAEAGGIGRAPAAPAEGPGRPYLEPGAARPRRRERHADGGLTFAGGLRSGAWGPGEAGSEVA